MNKETIRTRIEQIGIIPAIRLASALDALFAGSKTHLATVLPWGWQKKSPIGGSL